MIIMTIVAFLRRYHSFEWRVNVHDCFSTKVKFTVKEYFKTYNTRITIASLHGFSNFMLQKILFIIYEIHDDIYLLFVSLYK